MTDSGARIVLPERRVLSDDVYDAIKRSILNNRLIAGTKINLDDLAREIGVSNTPIRQALSRLEAEGFVVKEAYRGYTVSDLLDSGRLEEVFEVRMLLEPATCSWAASRRSEDIVAELRSLAERAAANFAEAGPLDARFHQTIAMATGNSTLAEEIVRLQQRTAPYRFTYDMDNFAEQAWNEHADITQTIAEGSAKAARAAMQRHLELSRERFRHMRRSD